MVNASEIRVLANSLANQCEGVSATLKYEAEELRKMSSHTLFDTGHAINPRGLIQAQAATIDTMAAELATLLRVWREQGKQSK